MRVLCVVIAVVLISVPGMTKDMLDQGSVETGINLQLDHRWGDRYENYDGKEETYLDASAVTGFFVADQLALGFYFHGMTHWLENAEGGIDVGPRMAYYFLPYSDGALYGDFTARFGRYSDINYATITAGLGHLYKLNSHIGLTTGIEYRVIKYADDYITDYTELEFHGGLRIFLFGGDK